MTEPTIRYVPRQIGEPLAQHLYRNADCLKVSRQQRERLRQAAIKSRGGQLDQIEGELIAVEVRAQIGEVLTEVIFTAQARGEAVEDVRDDDGAAAGYKRISGRDGLWTLIESRSLTVAQGNTALVYRELYVRVVSGVVGSQLGGAGGGGGQRASTTGVVLSGLRRAKAGVQMTEAEKALGSADRVAVLRAVAGEGQTIGSLTTSGHRRKVMTEGLAASLDIVRIVFAEIGGLRIAGS